MRKAKLTIFLLTIIVLIGFSLPGCGSKGGDGRDMTLKGGSKGGDGRDMTLKVGLMPAVDTVPMFYAKEKGFYEELGLQVELTVFNSGQDRQSALQTDAIDGAMTDLVAVATNVAGGFEIKATTMTNGEFPILMKEGSDEKTKVKVGMMEVSVTNFLVDQWLSDGYELEKVYINEIPTRLAAIVSGELDMGIFPEPFATMGALKGLKKVSFPFEDGYCPEVLAFTGKALREKKEAIRLFHQAYNKAVEDLKNNEQEARDILMKNLPGLDPAIKDDIIIPEFTTVMLHDDAYIEKIIQWTGNTMNKELKVKPDDLVDRSFLGR
jgi:NitT/TauT family transport system substrate-binding protein